MALGKITKTVVDQMQPGEWLWDADHREVVEGFGARRQRDGVFYYLRYRLHGRQHINSIGRHGSPYTPETARIEAKRRLGLGPCRQSRPEHRARSALLLSYSKTVRLLYGPPAVRQGR